MLHRLAESSLRDLQIPASLDEIYDALQNIIALPVPYQDRFRKNDFVFCFEKSDETGSESDAQNDSKSTPILQKGSLRIRIEIGLDF